MLGFKSFTFTLLLALFTVGSLSAQGDGPEEDRRQSRSGMHQDGNHDRSGRRGRGNFERIKAARQQFIIEELSLTEAEATAFFPVFWEYDEAMRDLMHEDRPDRRSRRDQNTSEAPELTEAQAREKLMAHLDKTERIAALKRSSTEAYLKLIPAKKLIGLEAANRAFRRELLDRIRRER